MSLIFPRMLMFQDFLHLSRFAIVGIVATFFHSIVAFMLISLCEINVFLANILGFIVAFFLSFTGHYFITFKSQRSKKEALIKFFAVAITGFIANNTLLFYLLEANKFSNGVTAVIAVLIVPIFTYTMSRLWCF